MVYYLFIFLLLFSGTMFFYNKYLLTITNGKDLLKQMKFWLPQEIYNSIKYQLYICPLIVIRATHNLAL